MIKLLKTSFLAVIYHKVYYLDMPALLIIFFLVGTFSFPQNKGKKYKIRFFTIKSIKETKY